MHPVSSAGQHDAHELLRFLLDGLNDELREALDDAGIKGPTVVEQVFGGRMRSSVVCLGCGKVQSGRIHRP